MEQAGLERPQEKFVAELYKNWLTVLKATPGTTAEAVALSDEESATNAFFAALRSKKDIIEAMFVPQFASTVAAYHITSDYMLEYRTRLYKRMWDDFLGRHLGADELVGEKFCRLAFAAVNARTYTCTRDLEGFESITPTIVCRYIEPRPPEPAQLSFRCPPLTQFLAGRNRAQLDETGLQDYVMQKWNEGGHREVTLQALAVSAQILGESERVLRILSAMLKANPTPSDDLLIWLSEAVVVSFPGTSFASTELERIRPKLTDPLRTRLQTTEAMVHTRWLLAISLGELENRRQGGGDDCMPVKGGNVLRGMERDAWKDEQLLRECGELEFASEIDLDDPKVPVTVKPFEICTSKVTNAEYSDFVRATGKKDPTDPTRMTFPYAVKHWILEDPHPQIRSIPVVNVSQKAAVEYAAWRSAGDKAHKYDLPTEDQWMRAVRGGSSNMFPFVFAPKPIDVNLAPFWACPESQLLAEFKGPSPVGLFPKARGGIGEPQMEDVVGNVREWTKDVDSKGNAVAKGTAFSDQLKEARCTHKWPLATDSPYANVGFRLVREPK